MPPEELLELAEAEVVAAEDEADITTVTRLNQLKGRLHRSSPAQKTSLLLHQTSPNKNLQLLEIQQDHLAEEEAEEGRGRASEVAQDTVPLELLCQAHHGDLAAISQWKPMMQMQMLPH
ncbi:hypothetical protein TGAMA5MH_05405 [Trichoderma gamsii]|uniref:Uncharacterized protein n=1 Tax=Trichoderma gamsii TaxID=398673 RepID=A0A2K0TAW0_9HYPO|nr:hypothetical protein TGAMA5MH_05405 [Trichoderma gamsii]